MKQPTNHPPVDVRVFEITITVAIPDYYGDGRAIDVSGYYELDSEAEQLGYRDRELTISYREEEKGNQ